MTLLSEGVHGCHRLPRYLDKELSIFEASTTTPFLLNHINDNANNDSLQPDELLLDGQGSWTLYVSP